MYNYHPVDGNPILLHAEEVLGTIINNKLSMNYLFDNKIKKYMLMKNTTTIFMKNWLALLLLAATTVVPWN